MPRKKADSTAKQVPWKPKDTRIDSVVAAVRQGKTSGERSRILAQKWKDIFGTEIKSFRRAQILTFIEYMDRPDSEVEALAAQIASSLIPAQMLQDFATRRSKAACELVVAYGEAMLLEDFVTLRTLLMPFLQAEIRDVVGMVVAIDAVSRRKGLKTRAHEIAEEVVDEGRSAGGRKKNFNVVYPKGKMQRPLELVEKQVANGKKLSSAITDVARQCNIPRSTLADNVNRKK